MLLARLAGEPPDVPAADASTLLPLQFAARRATARAADPRGSREVLSAIAHVHVEVIPMPSRTEEVKPLPCPFCGEKPYVAVAGAKTTLGKPGQKSVECINSDCPLYGDRFAWDAWNRRRELESRSSQPSPDATKLRVVEDERGQWWLWRATSRGDGFLWETVGESPIEVKAFRDPERDTEETKARSCKSQQECDKCGAFEVWVTVINEDHDDRRIRCHKCGDTFVSEGPDA